MQFKGLTQTTSNDQYVEVRCTGVQPYLAGATAWRNIANTAPTTENNGFLITCMTGIAQCVNDVTTRTQVAATTQLTAAEHKACVEDPRYLTWRMMNVAMKYEGTVQWIRTDSFWNPDSAFVSSSWGPAAVMSSHWVSATDSTTITATDQGKSYVFALSDGSGLQLAHITGGSAMVTVPTSNTTGGTGSNTLTLSPTAFTTVYPNRVDANYCSDTNMLLSGISDTSTLGATVTAFSDGYQATISMALDWVQAGAQGGWRGVCLVAYTSQFVQDSANGSICMTAIQATGTGMGSDLSGVYLVHIPQSTWLPPAASSAVSPASLALTDAKYGVVAAPAGTSYVFTGGFYASVAWYQPKFASTYADITRYGKEDYVGAYCM